MVGCVEWWGVWNGGVCGMVGCISLDFGKNIPLLMIIFVFVAFSVKQSSLCYYTLIC